MSNPLNHYIKSPEQQERESKKQDPVVEQQAPPVVDKEGKKEAIDEHEKWLEEGRTEMGFNVARKLKQEGFDPLFIVKITDLPLSKIENLG